MRTSIRKDNRGAALVTVLIAVTFMAILVTTLLYVSTTNYQTKQMDYLNKVSFYKTEAPLEEVRALLVIKASDACELAYKEVMLKYATLNATERKVLYQKRFAEIMYNMWDSLDTDDTLTDFHVLKGVFGVSGDNAACLMEDASMGACAFSVDTAKGEAVLKNVISSTTVNNYTTYIRTDIYIKAPDFNWNMETSGTYTEGSEVEKESVAMNECVVFKNWSKY